MSLYDTYTSLSQDATYSYKLVQLTSDVRERLERGEKISIKSDPNVPSHLVLTASDSTWKIRQMNHTNTALVMSSRQNWSPMFGQPQSNLSSEALISITGATYEYELTPIKGTISTATLPIYDPKIKEAKENVSKVSVDELINDSCISEMEFYDEWYKLGGSCIDGHAAVLSPRYISELLQLIITLLIHHKVDYKSEKLLDQMPRIAELVQLHSSTVPMSAVETVVHKFSNKESGQLDHTAVSEWFGIETLQKQASVRALSVRDFLMEWKSALPPFYNAPLDIVQLQGYFYRPTPDSVAYLDVSNLAALDLSARVKELFLVAKEWEWEDFMPFISSFVPTGKKPDAFMLKYCKRRRAGKRVFVSGR